jgi:hypothetical protein
MPGGVRGTWRRVRTVRAPDIARAARQARLFAVTCIHAAKYLPTVRRAVPWYIWPLLAIATAVKAVPVDFGVDEALFALAFALIAWRRPGLLRALYREAQAGKPAPCRCPRHT